VPDQGEILHLESGQPQGEGVWLGDPRSLVGKVWLKFGSEEVVAGRPAMRVETVAVPGESEMFPRHMPVLRGILVGAGGYALVDAGSGLVLRYEARDDEGRPMSRHEFVTIEIDEPIADEVFTYDIPPERRDRTPAERQLDLLEERGVDISGIDRDDPSAVRRAVEEHFRRFNEETDRREARLRMPSRRRPLAETVVPLGPPPADPESARAQIAEALQALTPDGQPKAGRVERGEVLDADGPERAHLMVRGRTVTIELLDVVFLRDDEALVEFQINVSGSVNVAFKGRVVRRDGRWLVSYDTAAHLRQLGGDPVPSLLDDLGDEPDDEGRR